MSLIEDFKENNWIFYHKQKFEKTNEYIFWEEPTTKKNLEIRFELLRKAYELEYGLKLLPPNKDLTHYNTKDISGYYKIVGHNPFNSAEQYQGFLLLIRIGPDKYHASWKMKDAAEFSQFGEGFVLENQLLLKFTYDEGEDADGEVIYEIHKDGILKGFWLEEGIFSPGFEKCIKLSAVT